MARYFFHNCERHLYYHGTPKEDRSAKKIPKRPYEHSPVTKAILDGGYDWEEKVVNEKINGKIHMTKKKGVLRDNVFDEGNTVKILEKMSEGEYLYQGCLSAPGSFYEEHNLDPSTVNFTNCFPDLLTVEDGRLRVIDVKASEEMKISHKVQVTLYSMILSHILKEKKIKIEEDQSLGGVWTYGKDDPEWFDMNTIKRQLYRLLQEDLPEISSKDPEELHWHLNYRCEWCEYYDHCRKEAEKSKSISLIPYLTNKGRRFLVEETGLHTLQELRKFLKKPEAPEILSKCASLSGKEKRLALSVEALLENKVIPFGGSSVAMPVGENIKLILTLQEEPLSGLIYTAALLRTGNDSIFSSGQRHEEQFVAKDKEDCVRVRREFIGRLYEILKEIHDYNEGKEWGEQKSLQTYVFDYFEWAFLRKMLMESLKDPDIAEKALSLLFYFHSEDLITAETQPEGETSFPVVIITSVIKNLFATPVPVAYQISKIVEVFRPKDRKAFDYNPIDYFSFRMSNSLKSDAIYDAWEKGKTDRLDWVRKELKKRLWAVYNVIDGIRSVANSNHGKQPVLFAWPLKFRLPLSEGFTHPTLSRLSFIARYESILDYLKMKTSRTLPRDEREQTGVSFSLKALNNTQFLLEGYKDIHILKEGRNWILSEDTPAGDMTQMSLTDFFYKDKPYLPSGKPLYHVDIYEDIIEEKENNEFLITLALNKKTKSAPPVVPGKKYLIQQRFLDWNSSRVSGRIMEIDQEEEPSCVKLIENPMEYMKKIKDKDGIKKKAEAMIKDHFTESQKDAFYHVLNYNLSLIWGPPGTGKTYFLAVSLLIMLEAYRKAGKPLKIMISAFTHPAIENCLKKIYQLNEEKKIWKEELFAVKLDYVKTQGCEDILQVIKKENCPEYLSSHDRCIIGGTTYSLLKPFKDDNTLKPFDILVIDEGSQLRVPESLLVISRLKEDGRLIIAGDDKQLPPIIKGIYPELEDGEPLLHSSIFDTLREADCDDEITCQLLENFRMNETLCLYPALGIYGTDYRSVNKKVAGRKIYLHKKTSDEFIKKVVDPKYPLVVCILDGITVGAENKAEADLVAYIACYLRENLCDKDTRTPYNTDEKFWKDGLFIVSPHHVQIRAIKAALSERGVYNPFVDTVEKMQGQEADAVIVSYGVADAELAMMEGEFIYNLNRLNVAITRGKAKVIVFLSRNLLTPDLQIMEDSEASAGISYMTGLEQFASEGEGWDFDMDEGATLTVYRR